MASTHWISMATLADPHDLLAAVRGLIDGAAGLQDICCAGTVVGLEAARQALSAHRAADDRILSLLRDIEPLTGVAGAGAILATSGRILTALKGTQTGGPRGLDAGRCWLSPAYRQQLVTRLQQREISLMVEAGDATGWASNSRVLLRHSTTPVKGLIQTRA